MSRDKTLQMTKRIVPFELFKFSFYGVPKHGTESSFRNVRIGKSIYIPLAEIIKERFMPLQWKSECNRR